MTRQKPQKKKKRNESKRVPPIEERNDRIRINGAVGAAASIFRAGIPDMTSLLRTVSCVKRCYYWYRFGFGLDK